jgi:riboflavin kinase / FMN adenylyltransferase
MQIFHGFAEVPQTFAESAVTLGNFDGVHLGHQALIRHMVERARASGRQAVVYTFEPHPVRILAPKLAPPRITHASEKARLLAALGVDACVMEPFTLELAATDHEKFVEEALVSKLHVKELIVGYDFTYGKGGKGNTASLASSAQRFGFSLEVISQQTFGGVVASSTKVREFVLGGNVEGARVLLGRDYSVTGNVVHGQKRGRGIGFPTANVDTTAELIPRYGVYACRVTVGEQTFGAVTNVGVRPTVNEGDPRPTVEAHLFDFDGDIYGKEVRVAFVQQLREERRFSDIDALKAQIAEDAKHARALVKP